ncbi:MAG: InlB B-repeat-containing protein, partial [Clostridia bacterium]|nr:InlB B-repeat-containing protein [Clostridia bacterium]
MKKTTKRALSFLLTLVMLVSTMSVGFFGITSLAAVVDDHKAVIAVPETVYMKPTGGAATVGQYYVNNTVSENSYAVGLEANSANTNAYLGLHIEGAKKFTVEISTLTSGIGDVVISDAGASSGSYEYSANSANVFEFNSNGYVAWPEGLGLYINGTGLNPGATAVAEWKFTVTMNDGSTRIYYAYTVLYSPHRSVGAVSESRRSGTYNNEISVWITGINGIGGKDNWAPITDGGGGDKTTSGYFKNDPLWTGLPSGGSSQSSDDFVTASTTEYYVEAKATDGSDGSRAVGYLGYITVDSSRYSNTNQIPNFKIGSDALRVNDSKKDSLEKYYAWYILGDDSTAKIGSSYSATPSGWTQFVSKSEPQSTSRDTLVPAYAISSVNGKRIQVANQAYCVYLSSKNYANASAAALFTTVDKSALRNAVIECTSLNANNYTTASWNDYQTVIRAAAERLGTPSNTNVDTSALKTEKDALQTTVKLNANGGSIGTTSFNVTVGTAATYNYNVSSYTPSRTGYTFKGWSTDKNATSGSTSSVNAGLMPTLYATWEANKYSVVFDNLIDFSKWNTSGEQFSNVTSGGFTLINTKSEGELTSSSPFFPVTPGKQYKIDIDFTGDNWDVYIFFCDANGTWVDFADGPSNRFSANGSTGIDPDNAVFTAPDKPEVVKAQIRVDTNVAGDSVTFENIRVYEVGTVEDGVSYEASKTVTYDSTIGTLPTPTRAGYEFLGWYKADGTQLNASDAVKTTDNIYVTSQWKKTGYTITWKVEGQQDVTTVAAPGETPSYPNGTPTKASTAEYTYTFTGWDTTPVAATVDATYTAQFKAEKRSYTITWLDDEGNLIDTTTVKYGDTPTHSAPTKESTPEFSYEFTGWSPAVVAVTGDKTYTATFKSNTREYWVSWVDHDGSVIKAAEKVAYGTTPTAPADPVRNSSAQYDYTFAGWTPKVDKITGDTTYTATYTESLRSYTITWVIDGVSETTTVKYGDVPTHANPTKAETDAYTYEFTGWDTTPVAVTGEATYTAQFKATKKSYTITWVIDGKSETTSVEYGEMPTHADPTKASTPEFSYTFTGWSPAIKAVDGAATYTAQFKEAKRSYTITFVNYDDEVLYSADFEYGTTPEYKGETPVKTGNAQYSYVFTGWGEIATVTGTATYKAQFEESTNVYTVTWKNYDGSLLETDENVPYGTTPKYDGATPVKPSTDQYEYVFENVWTPEVDEVTGDVTYTAQFTEKVRKYTVSWKNSDGTSIYTEEVEYGTVPVYDEATYGTPSKAATDKYTYTFKDWGEIAPVTGNVVYIAQFDSTVNKYTITWKNGDDVLKTEKVAYDELPVYDGTTPSKAADAQYTYTFAGWTPEVVTVTGDATYSAKYDTTLKTYTVTWINENGAVLETDTEVPYGTTPEYNGTTPAKDATGEFTYTFDKWSPEIADVTCDATYTATYTAEKNAYTITWIIDGKTETTRVEYGEMPTHADPTKAETDAYTYEFTGWTPTLAEVTGEATYTAQFEATKKSYTITWKNDDGSVIDRTTVEYGETPSHSDATKENTAEYTYTFAGWTPSVVAVTGDATYTATYTAQKNSYKITWKNDDGSVIDTTTVEYGKTPTHSDPTKAATAEYTYTFAGWTPAVVSVTGDAEYTATYTAKKNSYTITWLNEDGTEIDTTSVEYGEVPTHAAPTKANTAEYTYTFKGWTPDVAAVTGEATYKAVFTATKNKYTVTWVDEDGSVIRTDADVEYGTAVTAPANPTKAQDAQYTYTFAGWTPAVSSTVTGDATYTATYSSTKRSYEIKWVADGNTIRTDVVEYGETPVAPADPTKAADAQYTYTFTGWDNEIVAVTGPATYTAVFGTTLNEYTITWIVDGVETETTFKYGETPAFGSTPSKEATAEFTYTFDKWTPEVKSVTGEATYEAVFTATKNKYTVKWVDEDGSEIRTDADVEYGTAITAPANPSKEADAQYTYTFAGWSPAVSSTVTGDVTYTATYAGTLRSYAIKWEVNNVVVKTDVVEYGQKPEYTGETPTKAATTQYTYTFKGWTPAIETVTGEKTYVAEFDATVNKYTVTFENYDGTELYKADFDYGTMPEYKGDTPVKTAEGYTYTFKGWTPALAEVNGKATYTAEFTETVNVYTITWIGHNSTVTTEVAYGATVVAPAVPVKDGYIGVWGSYPATMPATDLTVNAEYVEDGITVNWVIETDSTVTHQTAVRRGQTITPDSAWAKDVLTVSTVYTFKGWSETKNGSIVTTFPTVTAADSGSKTYYAVFEESARKYTITWKNDNGSVIDTTEVAYGTVPTHADATKAADAQYTYTFDKWSPELVAVTGEATYTATYKADVNYYTVTWIVDGQTVKTEEVAYGDVPSFGSEPTKEATAQYTYTFAGWSPAVSSVTGKVTYTAQFNSTVNKYTVTWVDEDGTTILETDTGVEYGTKPSFDKAEPTKTATAQYTYTFAGWAGLTDETTVTGDVTFKATYTSTVNKYTVEFVNEDGTV